MSDVFRFNPFSMEDDVILELSTGRDKECKVILEIIDRNARAKDGNPLQHILLIGPRGMGKSFFLRLIQVQVKLKDISEFVLLPEEQLNIYQPADLIRQIRNKFLGNKDAAGIAMWSSGDIEGEWNKEIEDLEKALAQRNCSHIVAAVENFDLLLEKNGAFSDNRSAGLLRKFLTEKPWITLIATTLYPDIESQYEYPIYHFFARHELKRWEEEDHLAYLDKILQKSRGNRENGFSKAKLKALTRFTEGSPRITVIMVELLTKNLLDSAAKTLEHTIDELTPFYQDLINRMPKKSKLLFDALIRGGEPCTQSELAQRVGTAQNVISQHFNWLQVNGYLFSEKIPGKRYKLYSIRDRLFVHFYKMRYIQHGSGKSILTVMSEFLTQFYSSKELEKQALALYDKGMEPECRDLMKLTLQKLGIDVEKLSWKDDINVVKKVLELNAKEFNLDEESPEKEFDTLEEAWEMFDYSRDLLINHKGFPEDIEVFYAIIALMPKNIAGFETCVKAHKALALRSKQDKNIPAQAWNLGQIAVNTILIGNYEVAWKLIDSEYESLEGYRYRMVKQLGDVVSYYSKKNQISEAFAEGRKILAEFLKRKDVFEPARTQQEFFVNLLHENVQHSLISDLLDEAVKQFGEAMKLYLVAISGVLEYLESGKDDNSLLTMEPEKRNAVEVLIEQLNL